MILHISCTNSKDNVVNHMQMTYGGCKTDMSLIPRYCNTVQLYVIFIIDGNYIKYQLQTMCNIYSLDRVQ